MQQFICSIARYKPIINLLTALIPIVLATLGLYIAIQQYRTNRKKLKLDLFDKRFAIFKHANEYLNEILTNSADQEKQRIFLLGTSGARFIFGKDVKEYIDEIWEKSVEFEEWSLDQDTSEHSQQRAEHMKWFNKQLKCIENKFEKYMDLAH